MNTPIKSRLWKDIYFVKAYIFASEGMSDPNAARAMGISIHCFRGWKKNSRAFRLALKWGRKKFSGNDKGHGSLQDVIFNRLDPKYQKLWKRIDQCAKHPNAITRINILLNKKGDQAKKHLFLYALANSHFNPSEACRKVCIPYSNLRRWVEEDYEFAQLVEQIHDHKKNMVEGYAIKFAKSSPVTALALNRTLNKDRGYGDKLEVEHKGKIEHDHRHTIVLDESILSMLSKGTRREILNVVEAVQSKQIKSEQVDQSLLEQKGSTNGRIKS